MLGMIYSKIVEEVRIVNENWLEFRIRAKGPATIKQSFLIVIFSIDDKDVFDYVRIKGPYFFRVNDSKWLDINDSYSKGDILSIFCPKPSSINSGKHEIGVVAQGTSAKAKFKKELTPSKENVQLPGVIDAPKAASNDILFDFGSSKTTSKAESEPLFDFGSSPAKDSSRKCPNCGFPIDPSTGKCTVCGTKG